MRDYHFLTDCVHSTGEAINDMTLRAREITWKTFIKHVPVNEIEEIFPDYSYRGEIYNKDGELTCPFHIKDDYAVSFWKSHYKGKPCYYLTHSAIEYIFVQYEEN